MPATIIEECTISGVHLHFHRPNELPACIGRSFDNSVVIADPYVSPMHLVIEKNRDGWTVIDQGSENGTYLYRGKKNRALHAPADIVSGDGVVIGRTMLRFWSLGHPVPKALSFKASHGNVRHILVLCLSVLSLLGVVAGFAINHFLDSATRIKPIPLLAGVLPYIFFPLLWAGTCACAGYIVRRNAHFSLQLIVANCTLIGVLAIGALAEYTDYLTCSTKTADVVQYAGMMFVAVTLIFLNLVIITGIADLRRAIVSVAIGGGTIAVVALTDFSGRFDNILTPEYSQTLKPPYSIRIAKSISLEQYIKNCESLFVDNKK